MDPESTNNQAREEAGPKRSPRNPVAGNPLGNSGGSTVVALFRVGTRGCLLAAALMVVVTVLVTQTATQAIAEARQTVLYLDAPAVSMDRATRAGETAKAYSDPRSPALPDALAWLGVGPAAGDETGPPPRGASAAFASITAPDAEGTPGLTAEAAYDAGETMLAQIEDGAPPSSGGARESDLAAAGDADGVAVRPELGDGSRVPERSREEPSADYDAPPAEQPTTPDLASSPEPVEPSSESAVGPSGDEGLTLEAPAPTQTELAEVDPTSLGDASPAPRSSLDARPDYGATGPISEPAADPSTAPRDESAEGPAANPEDGGGELAGVQTAPAANPEPAQGTTREEPAYGGPVSGAEPADDTAPEDPVATPDTGPTGSRGDAVVPAPSTPPADDAATHPVTPEDPTSASPAPADPAPKGSVLEGSAPAAAGQDDGSGEEIPGDRAAEIVVVQASEAGGGADAPASASQRVPPSDDRASEPEVTPPPEPTPEEAPAGANTTPDGTSPDLPEGLPAPDSSLQEGTDAASGSGEDSAAASPSLVGEPGDEPTEPTADQSGEQPAGGHQDDPTETTTAEGSPPTPASPPDEGTTGQEPTPTDETGGDHASQEAFQGGDQVVPEDDTEQAPVLDDDPSPRPTAEPDADDQASEDDAPQDVSQYHDHRAGTLPNAGLERAGEDDGDAEGEQEEDQRSTGPSGDQQQSATEIRREESSGDGPGWAGFDGTGRSVQAPAAPEGRSGDDEGASREDAEAESSESSRTASYLIRPVGSADRDLAGSGGDRVDPAGTEAARAVPSSGGPSGLSPERRTDGEPPQGTRRQPDTGPVASKPAPGSTPGRASTAPKERPVNGNGGAWRTPPAWAPAWGRGGVPGRPDGRSNGQRAAGEEAAGDRRAAVRADRLARRQAAERADRRSSAWQAAREKARRERVARRRQFAAEKAAASRRADRVAERHAERTAGRIAARQAARQVARERAAADRAAIRDQRRQNRLTARGVFGAQSQAAPAADRRVRRTAEEPSYKGPLAAPSAAEQVPVPRVGTQRTAPVERPPAMQPLPCNRPRPGRSRRRVSIPHPGSSRRFKPDPDSSPRRTAAPVRSVEASRCPGPSTPTPAGRG